MPTPIPNYHNPIWVSYSRCFLLFTFYVFGTIAKVSFSYFYIFSQVFNYLGRRWKSALCQVWCWNCPNRYFAFAACARCCRRSWRYCGLFRWGLSIISCGRCSGGWVPGGVRGWNGKHVFTERECFDFASEDTSTVSKRNFGRPCQVVEDLQTQTTILVEANCGLSLAIIFQHAFDWINIASTQEWKDNRADFSSVSSLLSTSWTKVCTCPNIYPESLWKYWSPWFLIQANP